jgi:hypothetical protein
MQIAVIALSTVLLLLAFGVGYVVYRVTIAK